MIKVNFPNGDDVQDHFVSALKIITEMEKDFKKNKKISLDFSEMCWFIPCSIILMSNKILDFLGKGAKISYFPPKNLKARNHLKRIGFPLGNETSGRSYVPITHFEKIKDQNQVNEEMNILIKKIESKIPQKFGDSINYILGELSENIDNHSEFSRASLMAQYFPTKEKVDLVVLDNGITIPGIFEKNGIKFETDGDALKKAVSGEVTTKKNDVMRGYGLKSCKEISTDVNRGELYIASRGGIARFFSDKEPIFSSLEGLFLNGTFIYLRLDTPKRKINILEHLS